MKQVHSTSNHIMPLPQPLKILIIEDNRGDALLITKTIEQALLGDCHLVIVKTLEEGLKHISQQQFDVALLDRNLPDAKGANGLFSIQNMAPKLPVIVLTSYQDEQKALEAIQSGAQDYLFKGQTDSLTIRRAIQYAILRKEFEHVLIMRANYDMLTGLVNRGLFENRLDMALVKAKRHRRTMSVLFLDLDGFKEVNDVFGHAIGDKLLKEVGARIRQSLRAEDTIARFGGDEFAILLEDISNALYSEVIAQKIIDAMNGPFNLSVTSLYVAISIGIAICSPQCYYDKEALLHNVDLTMYEAKAISGSTYRVFASN